MLCYSQCSGYPLCACGHAYNYPQAPAPQPAQIYTIYPAPPFTEEQLRRIIREELERRDTLEHTD